MPNLISRLRAAVLSLFALAGFDSARVTTDAAGQPPRRGWRPLLLILALAVIMRVGYLPGIALITDIGYSAGWGAYMARHGLANLYEQPDYDQGQNVKTSNYPPVFMAMLGLAATAQDIIGPRIPDSENIFLFTARTPQFLALLKLFPVLGDLGLIVVVYAWLRQRSRWYWLIPLLLAIHPAMIIDSAWWGQSDSLMTLLVLLTLLALHEDRPRCAWAFFALAMLTKFQSVTIAPLLLILTLRRYGLRTVMAGLGISVLIAVPLLAPFVAVSGLNKALGPYLTAVGLYPVTTKQADNLWYLLSPSGAEVSDAVPVVGPFTYRHIGLAMLALSVLVISAAAWRHANQKREFVWATALYFSFFMLPTQIHDRYLYPGAILALIAAAQDRRMWLVGIASMYTQAANLLQATNPFQWLGLPFMIETTPVQVSVINVVLFVEVMRITLDPHFRIGGRLGRVSHALVKLPRLAAGLACLSIVAHFMTVSAADAATAGWLAGHVAESSRIVIESRVTEVEKLTKNWPVGWQLDWQTVDSAAARTVPEWLNAGVHYLVVDTSGSPDRPDSLAAQGATVVYTTKLPAGAGRAVLWTFRPQQPLNVVFDGSLFLAGYHVLQAEDGGVGLLFHWYTQRPTPDAYNVFIHVLDPVTGELVGQADAPLGRGSHPSNTWRLNEIVFETVQIPVDILRRVSRPYHVRLGLYQVGTGTRAAITDESGQALGDHLDIVIP
jgi:Gpi18-like mannosyltransferase